MGITHQLYKFKYIYISTDIHVKNRGINLYIYIWSRVPCSYPPPPPPMVWVPRLHPFPSICKLLAAFLRSTLVFARSLLHFWLPASHLLGTCYLLDDLRSTHTSSKYLRATYSHIYMCYVSTSYKYIYIYIHTHIIDTYIYVYTYTLLFIYTYIHTYVRTYVRT